MKSTLLRIRSTCSMYYSRKEFVEKLAGALSSQPKTALKSLDNLVNETTAKQLVQEAAALLTIFQKNRNIVLDSPIPKKEFSLRDRVVLASDRYTDDKTNPWWGGRYGFIMGTIIESNSGDYRVRWDNGKTNGYDIGDLRTLKVLDKKAKKP